MSRISKLIANLEDLHQQYLKNAAQVYGITATLTVRLQEVLNSLSEQNLNIAHKSLPEGNLTKDDIISLYGNYNNAYKAYKEAYNIKCSKGWEAFLQAIHGLKPPGLSLSLEQRVEQLEKTVKTLVEILLDKT